ncbi:DUF5916 domain-containing protein [Anaeromyxobacter sp. SG17]|uniref:DUF5916 domain-containing protein n=1 Tax=Anaeromyxobacter sp. SG17 TaxID=2925405 RepID=UPI001F599772|nr:DUF5916 domain-containing protein [Anaeromyxobacter sp. SG17]
MLRRSLALLSVAFSLPALAAAPGEPLTAARRTGDIVLDGRLEDPAWDLTPAFDGFVQVFPAQGAPPSERTEVRVLFDDRALYVGIVAHDRSPGEVRRPLGRRDRAPYSDAVTVVIDSMGDHRAAYVFELNAAGVQTDALLFEDDSSTGDWDAVWEAATAALPDGWGAELRIPLAALRFSNAPVQTWGFGVKRVIARRHEEVLSVLIPRGTRGQIARLGSLVGLEGLRPVQELEVAPYTAARLAFRPRVSDVPRPRDVDPVGDVGLDVRASLGRAVSLQGTLNPDFGQVEADEIIQNLSTFEIFFPEKRPFFTQGMDLFQPVAIPNRRSPQQLFYSRRIGLDAPILGAAKLTGKPSDTLQVGFADALVTGAGAGLPEATPDRSFRFDAAQPLHFGPRAALPELAPAPRNFLAGVARYQPAPSRSFGATFTSALPLGPACSIEDAEKDDEADDPRLRRPARCDVLGGNAAALDWNLRSRDGAWFLLGQVTGSQALGGAPTRAAPGAPISPRSRTLADGTVLEEGDLGYGAHAAVGRVGGEPWRFEVHWEYESPRLELNALGYQRTQNEQLGRALVRYVRPTGGGPFHSYALVTGVEGHRTTDGRGLARTKQVWIGGEAQLRTYQWVGCTALAEDRSWDVREISETGVALEKAPFTYAECYAALDPSRPVYLEVAAGSGRTAAVGPLGALGYWGTKGMLVVRPHARLESRLDVHYEASRWRARYVDEPTPGVYRFGDLGAPSLSVTVRQQLVVTPRLTLQGYAQLFASYGEFRGFRQAAARDRKVTLASLSPAEAPPPSENDFREGALNLNAVLRWEYRLGSTLYLVYTRAQRELEWDGASALPVTLGPHALGAGPATDTFLVKWTYYWTR